MAKKAEEKKANKLKTWAYWIFVAIAVLFFYSYAFGESKESWLEENGYEVLEIGSYEFSGEQTAYVDMKSLGNRRDQVMDGWISLSQKYPEMDDYHVSIIEERRSCSYSIEGVILNPYLTSLTEDVIIDSAKVKETFSYLMWSLYAKAEYEKYMSGNDGSLLIASSYQRLMEDGLDKIHLSEIINSQINDSFSCE